MTQKLFLVQFYFISLSPDFSLASILNYFKVFNFIKFLLYVMSANRRQGTTANMICAKIIQKEIE